MLAKRTLKIALMALAIVSTCAQANPNGPTVVNGSASFSQPNANTLNITTKTNKAIINWQGFNIGAGQTTNFHQPNRNSAVLNRVLSNSPSKIYGNLNSNGKVFLINQHGLMIGAGAKINTGGFFGSTLNITNEDFLNGNLKFEGGGFGGIINKGYIHAGPGGNVVLIAPDINNGGVIEVEDGKVILAAGKSIRITSLNDALIEFDVKSNDDNTIINLGDIVAKHGAVRLFAGSLKHSGSINANSLVQNADGSISLVANTTAEITGELIAGGDQGGRITVEAETINVSGHALINASGPAGGGTILIGGDRQGLNPDIRNATSTTVGPHARIHADATDSGDGGKVILFAERDVHVHGEVSARGGPHGGDGGFVETSGLQVLDITRAPDASASNGQAGEWLIDPFNITIQDAGPDSGITGGPSPTPLVSNAPAVLTTVTIETALNNGTSVTVTTGGTAGDLQGNGDITVADPIDKTAGGVAALTLNAHNNITVNAPISASGANALSITLLADSDSDTQGSINIAAPITTNNGDVILDATTSLDASSITIGSDINAGAGDIDLRTSAGINAVLQSGVIIANALTSSTLTDLTVDRIAPTPVLDGLILDLNVDIINGSFLQAQNGLTLGGVNNASPTITLASTGNPTEFNIMNTTTIGGTGTILLADNFSNNNLFRPISGTMTIGAGITVSGRGEVGGTFGGTSTVNQGVINANSASGTLTLTNVDNNGTVNIANGSTLALDGVITTDDIGVLVNAGTGTINLAGDLDNTGNILALTASTGDLRIDGSITNGTVTTAGGSALLAGFNGTLDNVAINGDLSVGFGSTINLSNSVSVTNSLANSGTINVLAGSLFAVSGGGTQTGTFSIASGATLSLSGVAQTWTGASIPDASTGTLSVSTDLDLTGSGGLGTGVTLSVSAGTVGFGNNVPAVGTLNITSTGAVTSSSALAVTNDVTINGSGASLTITAVGTGTLDVGGNLNLRQGTLDASGDISVTGPTIWNPLSTGSTETFTITGPGILVANGGFNLGTNLDANDQLVLDKFLFINSFSSWDDAGSGTLSIIGGGIIFNNDFIQVNSIATGSAAQLDIAVPVTNIGEISKENGLGSLIFSAGLSVTGGDLNVSTGTTVEATGLILNGGELRGGGTLIGDLTSLGGVIDIEDPDGSPGTLSIIGAVSFLDQNSSIVFDIAGPADFDVLNITGDLNLAGGYMVALWDEQYAGNGSHTLITTTGTVNGGFTDEYLPAGTTGAGTAISVLPNSYSIALDTGGNVINFFTNALGGDWNTAGNWSAGAPQAGQYAVIAQDNDTIEVTVAANSGVAGIEAQNTIRINNGSTLTVSGANPNATLDYIFADVILEGAGVLSIDGTALLTDVTTLDSGNLSGTGLYINHPLGTLNIVGANGNNLTSSFDNNGVILNGFGPGTLTISAGGTLENFGKVQPGGPDNQGVLTFDGDFINRPTGVVEIEVAGPNGVPGDDHDQLVITGDANLFGTLALLPLGNFTANNGDSDIVAVTYGSFQNGFATIQPIDSEAITPVYGANELTLQFAVSQLFTWAAAANGDWNTGINWDLGTVPTVGDDAIIGFGGLNITISANAGINTLSLAATNTLTLNSGTFTIAGDTSLDGGLNLAGGVLIGDGNLTLSNALNWTGGSIAGAGQLTTTATSTLNSGGTLGIGRDWLNIGTINHTNGVLQIQNGAFITNVGSYNANGGTQISANGGAGIEGFFNAGQFNVNADILVQPEVFDNDGTVTVGSGFVLSLGATGAGAAGNQTGTWDFADATISLLNNEWIISPGFTILSQPGAVLNLSGGTLTNSLGGLLTLPANVAVNLNNNSSVIQGNDDIQIDGAFNWSAGTLQGSGLLTTTGISTVNSAGTLGTQRDWSNIGTINHSGGVLQSRNGAVITNSAIYNANGGTQITSNGGPGIEAFFNTGQFNVNADILVQPQLFDNLGTITVSSGFVLSLGATGGGVASNQTGTWDFSDATISLVNNEWIVGSGFTILSQPGAVLNLAGGILTNSSGGLLTLPVNVTVNLNNNGSVIQGNDDIQIDGDLNWSAGTLEGSGLLTTAGTTTLNSGGNLGTQRDWINNGIINHTGGVLQPRNGVTITNNAVYNVNGGSQISANGGTGIEAFINTASGQMSIGSNFLIQPEQFDNAGTITVLSGSTLSLGVAGTSVPSNQTGTWDFSDATISLVGNSWVLGAGFAILSQPGATLNLSGGDLDNSSGGLITLPANVTVNLNNGGSSILGANALQIDGGFNWSAGTLQGSGLLTTTGTTTISSGGSLGTSKDWNNVGVIDHLAGQLQIQNGATITNGNIFNANGGSAITSNGGTGIELFNNAAGGLFTVTSNISIQPEQFIQDGLLEIVGGATVSTNNADLTNTLNGVILATGTIDVGLGTLINDGTIHPGDVGNTGILTVLGNFTQSASGNLEIEIDDTGTQAGLDYDQLAVTSSTVPAVTLDGSLSVTLLNGDPLINDTFTLIDVSGGGSVAGFFANEFLPSGFDPLVYGPNFVNTVFSVLSFFFDNDFGDFSWNSPTNWSTDVLPTSVDDVSISGFDVAISDVAEANTLSLAAGGTLALNAGTLTIASDSTLDGLLQIAGGNLDIGTASVTLAGGLAWTGTSNIIGNGGILNLPATNTFSGAFSRFLLGVTANISGPTTYSDGTLNLGESNGIFAFINNSGVFDFAGDVSIEDFTDGGLPGFNNLDGGTLVKSAGVGTSSIFTPLNSNQGSVIVQSGTLIPNVTSWTLGPGDVFSGDGIYVGDVVNNGGTVRPGGDGSTGTLTVSGDFTNTSGAVVIDIANDDDTQASLVAGLDYDQLMITGQADLNGSLVLNGVNGFTFSNNGATFSQVITFGSKTVNEFGSIVSIGSETITPTYTGDLVTPGDLGFLLSFTGLFEWNDAAGNGIWNDAGNWNFGIPTIDNDVSIGGLGEFYNVTINADADAGTLAIGPNATLTLSGGDCSGPCQVFQIAANSTLDGLLTIAGGNLDIGTATVTLAGGFAWTGTSDIIGNGGILNLPATNTFSGAGFRGLQGVTANISGPTTYSQGSLDLFDAIINNSGVFDFAGDVSIQDFTDGGSPSFNNLDGGTLLKSAGVGTSSIFTPLNSNEGSVIVQTGTLDTGVATWTLGTGDSLSGSGTYIGDVVNAAGGVVSPGGASAIGILSISGNYTQSGGRLEIEVLDGGTQAGVNYDQLAISGTGTWTNTTAALDISYLNNGYVPSAGDAHTVVTCGDCGLGIDMGPITEPAGVTYLFSNNGTSYIATIDTVIFAWDGGGDGVDWFDANNWLFNVTPDASIDAVISAGNTVNIVFDSDAGPAAANSLTLGGSLNIVNDGNLTIQDSVIDLLINPGGALTVNVGTGGLNNNGDAVINGSLALLNGNLNLAGNTVVNGSYTQSGGSAGFTGALTVNGSYSQSGGSALFNGGTSVPGSFSLSGAGVANFFTDVVASGSFTQTGGSAIFNVSTSALFSGSFVQSGGSSIFNSLVDFPGTVNLSGGLFSIDGFATLSNLNNNWSGGTISGAGSLVLGSVPGDTALAITGPAVKTLDFITLEMNQNDINMSGNGNLLLTNNAVIINDGNTFNHSGDGSIAGVGTLDNSGGTFNKFAGTGTIAVDLINDASSTINVAGGTLVIDDPGVGDSATYNVDSTGMLVFAQNRQLDGALNLNGTVVAGPLTATPASTTTLTLPASLVYNGSILLNDANLDLSSLSGNTLVMNAGSQLGGRGTVQGNIDNVAGVLTAGGNDALGNLEVSGAYSHGPSAVVVASILNDGVDTLSSVVTIDGAAQLNGGTLLIGYLNESIAAVTADFIPIQFRDTVTGEFARSIDADGSVLLVEYAPNALTVLGSTIEITDLSDIPDSIVDDQVRFLNDLNSLNELISSNKSEAEAMIQDLLDEAEESGSLVCN